MPRDSSPPYFQFYPDDFASDGDVEAMTTAQVGAYMLLLCKAWREDPVGSVPDDDRRLARWARMSAEEWSEAKPAVMAPFSLRADGRWHQPRMQREYMKLRESSRRRAEAGTAGAEKRWKNRTVDGDANGIAIAQPKQSHSKANGQPMRSHGTSTSETEGNGLASPILPLGLQGECADCLDSEKNEPESTPDCAQGGASTTAMQVVVDLWNMTEGVRTCRNLSPKRRRAMTARLADQYWSKNWREAIAVVGRSGFCRGKNDRSWRADIDWFLRPDTVTRLMEGAYDSRSGVDFSGLEEFFAT